MGEAITGIVGVVLGVAVTLLAARRSEKAEAYRAIAATYDRILDFRTAHPEVLRLSSQWTPERWREVYVHGPSEDVRWSRYYGLVETYLAFVNTVLSARDERLLSTKAFTHQWKPLVELAIAEHYPAVAFMEQGPYLSNYVRAFLKSSCTSKEWQVRHSRLTGLESGA